MLKRINAEFVYLGIFVSILLTILANHSGNMFVHEGGPYQYLAGDMFWLASEAEGIKATNDLFQRPAFLMGGHNDSYNNFPMGLPIATTVLSYPTQTETYDSLFHLNYFFAILCIVMIYLILRKFHPTVAMLGTPLTLFFFRFPFSYPLNFGGQMSMMNMAVVLATALAFLYLDKKWMWIVLGLLNGLGFYVHGRESLVLNVCIAIYFVLTIRQFNFDLFKKYVYSVMLTVFTMIPILPLYFKTLEVRKVDIWGNLISWCPSTDISHTVLFSNFSYLKWLLIAGIIIAIVYAIWKISWGETGNELFIVTFFLGTLFMSYFCVLGNKTTQIRHFFPFTLSLYAAAVLLVITCGAYFGFKMLTKKDGENPFNYFNNLWFALVVGVMLMIAILITNTQTIPEYPVSNPDTWAAMKWVRENVSDSENILMMYGDNHYQATMFYLMKKTHASIEQSDYYDKIDQKIITPETRVLEGILGFYFIRNGTFDVENKGITFYSNKTLCDYDYVYFNIKSEVPIIQEYTRAIGTILMDESGFYQVYQNNLVVILKNPNKGGQCFEPKQIEINNQ